MRIISFFRILPVVFLFCSCERENIDVWTNGIEVATDTVAYQDVFDKQDNNVLTIDGDIDLENRLCCIPKGFSLRFQKGVIRNGTLVGNETNIESTGTCFDRVRILGTWNVPDISTEMFRNLDYDNSLKDVVALANPKIKNRIVIEEGDYQVSALHGADVCLQLCANTEVIMNGTIRMVPNDFKHYYIFRMGGANIRMRGNGTIIGDKDKHLGNDGEWGMGIDILNAHNVEISGLTIKNCWGDCIYVGEKSTHVLIENCRLDHGRRQGISITGSEWVKVLNCEITNVGGTDPEYAIDVEPNKGETTDHVTIEEVIAKDCKGGMKVYGRAEGARVGTVIVRNCDIEGKKKEPIAAAKCDTLIVDNSNITMRNGWACVSCNEVGHLALTGNTIWYANGLFHHIKDWARPLFGKSKVKMMDIGLCGTKKMENNKYREL